MVHHVLAQDLHDVAHYRNMRDYHHVRYIRREEYLENELGEIVHRQEGY